MVPSQLFVSQLNRKAGHNFFGNVSFWVCTQHKKCMVCLDVPRTKLPEPMSKLWLPINPLERTPRQTEVITYTTLQWVCKVIQMKNARKMSNIQVAESFSTREFQYAQNQEEITETFVENAVYVWNRALCYPEVAH